MSSRHIQRWRRGYLFLKRGGITKWIERQDEVNIRCIAKFPFSFLQTHNAKRFYHFTTYSTINGKCASFTRCGSHDHKKERKMKKEKMHGKLCNKKFAHSQKGKLTGDMLSTKFLAPHTSNVKTVHKDEVGGKKPPRRVSEKRAQQHVQITQTTMKNRNEEFTWFSLPIFFYSSFFFFSFPFFFIG